MDPKDVYIVLWMCATSALGLVTYFEIKAIRYIIDLLHTDASTLIKILSKQQKERRVPPPVPYIEDIPTLRNASIRVCIKCGELFSEGARGSRTFTVIDPSTENITYSACPECVTT